MLWYVPQTTKSGWSRKERKQILVQGEIEEEEHYKYRTACDREFDVIRFVRIISDNICNADFCLAMIIRN